MRNICIHQVCIAEDVVPRPLSLQNHEICCISCHSGPPSRDLLAQFFPFFPKITGNARTVLLFLPRNRPICCRTSFHLVHISYLQAVMDVQMTTSRDVLLVFRIYLNRAADFLLGRHLILHCGSPGMPSTRFVRSMGQCAPSSPYQSSKRNVSIALRSL